MAGWRRRAATRPPATRAMAEQQQREVRNTLCYTTDARAACPRRPRTHRTRPTAALRRPQLLALLARGPERMLPATQRCCCRDDALVARARARARLSAAARALLLAASAHVVGHLYPQEQHDGRVGNDSHEAAPARRSTQRRSTHVRAGTRAAGGDAGECHADAAGAAAARTQTVVAHHPPFLAPRTTPHHTTPHHTTPNHPSPTRAHPHPASSMLR
jgi:hypothetical protein